MDDRCEIYNESAFGYTPQQACVVCGGGFSTLIFVETTNTLAEGCLSLEGWRSIESLGEEEHDGYGVVYDCNWYVNTLEGIGIEYENYENYVEGEPGTNTRCSLFGANDENSGGYTPNYACCACGGGFNSDGQANRADLEPTAVPPSEAPTKEPTLAPTVALTKEPTLAPTEAPTKEPTPVPTSEPTAAPTYGSIPCTDITDNWVALPNSQMIVMDEEIAGTNTRYIVDTMKFLPEELEIEVITNNCALSIKSNSLTAFGTFGSETSKFMSNGKIVSGGDNITSINTTTIGTATCKNLPDIKCAYNYDEGDIRVETPNCISKEEDAFYCCLDTGDTGCDGPVEGDGWC